MNYDKENDAYALHICVWKACNFSIDQVGIVENSETERSPTITFSLDSPQPPNRATILQVLHNASSTVADGLDALGISF